MSAYVLLALFLIIALPIRLLRWLSLVQQKEYRFDRLKAFISTKDGLLEIVRLLPIKNDFSKSGLKRPGITLRILFVTSITALLIVLYLLSIYVQTQSLSVLFVHIIISYICIPLWILLATLPSTLISLVITLYELKKAKEKIKKYSPKIIGITGSYGKTSTKHLLTHILKEKYSVFTTPFSHNTKYSIARAINKNYNGEEIVVLEYAAYAKNEIKELTKWFKPDEAIITGLAPQHLELFGNIENIIKAKAELIKALPDASRVYYFSEDTGAKKIVDEGSKNRKFEIISVDKTVLDIKSYYVEDTEARLVLILNNKELNTPFIGHQYLAAILLACAVSLKQKISSQDVVKRIKNFTPNKNFIRSYTLKNGALVIDDGGSANSKGVSSALELLFKTFPSWQHKKYLLFPGIVDLGNESDSIHQQLAREAFASCHEVFYVGNVGKEQFQQYPLFVTDIQDQIIEKLRKTQKTDILLIEGRMPAWVLAEIKKLQ